MTKTATNYRFSAATLRQLDELAQEYNDTRTGMLERLVAAAHASRFGEPQPPQVDGAQIVEYMKAAPGR